MTPSLILKARSRNALARMARGETAHMLGAELGWSAKRIAALIKCSASHVRALQRERAKLLAGFQNRAIDEHQTEFAAMDAEELALQVRELSEKLARLTGADLADEFAEAYKLPRRCAIVMAILARAYPRAVSVDTLCELYDDACQRLSYGCQRGADRELIRKNVSDLNRAMLAQGLPMASEIAPETSGRRLTEKAAALLSASHQTPRQSQLLARAERLERKPWKSATTMRAA